MSAAAILSLKFSAYRSPWHLVARLKLHSVLMEAQVGKLEEAPRGEA